MSVDPRMKFFSGYTYVGNNPILYVDPNGEESFHVSRSLSNPFLGNIASHNFIATHAEYIGDPNAVIMFFGKTNEGKVGIVYHGTEGFSKGTMQTDQAF